MEHTLKRRGDKWMSSLLGYLVLSHIQVNAVMNSLNIIDAFFNSQGRRKATRVANQSRERKSFFWTTHDFHYILVLKKP